MIQRHSTFNVIIEVTECLQLDTTETNETHDLHKHRGLFKCCTICQTLCNPKVYNGYQLTDLINKKLNTKYKPPLKWKVLNYRDSSYGLISLVDNIDNIGPNLLQIDETIGSFNLDGTGMEIRFKIGKYPIDKQRMLQEIKDTSTHILPFKDHAFKNEMMTTFKTPYINFYNDCKTPNYIDFFFCWPVQ